MSLKRTAALAVFIPLAAVLILFIIANRGAAAVHFNVFAALFGRADSAASVTLPLFIWLFLFFALGALCAFAAQLKPHFQRKRQIKALEREIARLAAASQTPPRAAESEE